MGFEISEKVQAINAQLEAFMQAHIFPREHDWNDFTLNPENLWQVPDWYDGLRDKAKQEGLWNL
jgi:acyl-CoA dehydrogenase